MCCGETTKKIALSGQSVQRLTGNDISGTIYNIPPPFFPVSPSSTLLIEGVLKSKNLINKSRWDFRNCH